MHTNFVRRVFFRVPAHCGIFLRKSNTMSNGTVEPNPPAALSQLWRPVQVIVMSAVCLVVGIAVGYLLRGSAPTVSAPAPAARTVAAPASMPGAAGSQPMPSLDDLKRM